MRVVAVGVVGVIVGVGGAIEDVSWIEEILQTFTDAQ